MITRSWRKWGVMVTLLLLLAQAAIAAPPLRELDERVLQAIVRHADREAATALVEAWQQQAQGAVSPGSVALNEGLNGHYLTAKHLMARVVAEKPDDASVRLGSLVLVLLEGNPPTCRRAIEELLALYPDNPQLLQRYADVLESMGLSASTPPPRPEEPAETPDVEPTEAPVAVPTPASTAAPREIRPVQAESVREQLLRQLAESQARQAREEAARQKKAKEEQARKRREEAERLAAEKKRREDAARQAVELKRQAELARQAAERQKAEQARLAAEKRQTEARQASERQKVEQARLAAEKHQAEERQAEQRNLAEQRKKADEQKAVEQRQRLERAEQERWVAARRNQPSSSPVQPVVPTPPPVQAPSYVLKPVKIANRRVWIGEARSSVHARLGRPRSVEGPGIERYAGLSIWYDQRGKVSTFELDSAWFSGPGGVRPGLTLREVLKALPNSDGLFHLRPSGPEATNSLYVLSTVDGTLAELQFNDEVWLSTLVRTTTPAKATHLYEELLQKGPVRRLAADYVFALEARRRPLP